MPRDTPQSIVDECRSYGAEVELVAGVITDAGKRVAQYIAEWHQHIGCRLDIGAHQRLDALKRVAEKVRIELRLECAQLRLGALAASLCQCVASPRLRVRIAPRITERAKAFDRQ